MNRLFARAARRTEPPAPARDDLSWLHRSEAFAEDVQDLVAPLPQWHEGAPQGRAPRLRGVGDGAKARAQDSVDRPAASATVRRSDGGGNGANAADWGWQHA